ncbi:hypothetical protein MSC49_28850 [Methylosinus sp. C49]|nr:hypothetical protein MSC49_28850 [Methylosinus sp. C49]
MGEEIGLRKQPYQRFDDLLTAAHADEPIVNDRHAHLFSHLDPRTEARERANDEAGHEPGFENTVEVINIP